MIPTWPKTRPLCTYVPASVKPCCGLSSVYRAPSPDSHDGCCSYPLGHLSCLVDGVSGGIDTSTREYGAIDANLCMD